MMPIFTAVLDWCFPPRSDAVLVRTCTGTTPPLQPKIIEPNIVTLLAYSDARVRALIHEAKYYHNPKAQEVLATALESYICTLPGPVTLIPIPLSTQRHRDRGYNQVQAIISRHHSLRRNLATEYVRRTRHTKPQTSLNRTDRINNMTHAFAVQPAGTFVSSHTYIVVDDVVTTGATLSAARAALIPHIPTDSTLICLALAH